MTRSAGIRALVEPLVAFGLELRRRGLDVGPGRVESAVRAMACVDVRDMDENYWALRCALTSCREDLEAFNQVFAEYWHGASVRDFGLGSDIPSVASQREPQGSGPPEDRSPSWDGERAPFDAPLGTQSTNRLSEEVEAGGDDPDRDRLGAEFSPVERLRGMDFRQWGSEELAAARPYMKRIARALPRRLTRRRRGGSGGPVIDRRGTLRHAMRTEGHPIELMRMERRTAKRRIVLLVDVSGSMEAYGRPLIMFCQAVRQASSRVEAFTFGTRLTRLTRELSERNYERAMSTVASAVPDWAGGTRIGENLRTLNAEWGRRGITRGALVIVFSDGWERGDVDLLGREMERLHRVARTVAWVNPLAGEPGYEPLAAGMAAALPHVDHFMPGHDLASLERLAATLELVGQEPGGHDGRLPALIQPPAERPAQPRNTG